MQTLKLPSSTNEFRVEYQILSRIKDALRVTVRWRVPNAALDQKISSVRFTLKSLQRHMSRLMELEEEDGYLSSIVRDQNPNMQERVHLLLKDHEEFRERIARVVDAADSVAESEHAAVQRLCDRVTMLLAQIEEHEHAESELLQQAMLFDVGGEG